MDCLWLKFKKITFSSAIRVFKKKTKELVIADSAGNTIHLCFLCLMLYYSLWLSVFSLHASLHTIFLACFSQSLNFKPSFLCYGGLSAAIIWGSSYLMKAALSQTLPGTAPTFIWMMLLQWHNGALRAKGLGSAWWDSSQWQLAWVLKSGHDPLCFESW